MRRRSPTDWERMPGWELVSVGLADLAAGRQTVPALLVASASIRLGELGFMIGRADTGDPQARLYELVEAEVGEGQAHGHYNALRRRLSSFLRSAAHAPAD